MTTFQTNKEGSFIDQLLGIDIPFDGRAQLWATEDLMGSWEILEDNGWDSPFTYGGRTMTTWNQRLVVGTGSSLLIPDIFSDPYNVPTPDEWIAYLQSQGYDELAALLASVDWDAYLPYIGTEVFVSNAIPEPATLGLTTLGLMLLGRYRHRKRRHL